MTLTKRGRGWAVEWPDDSYDGLPPDLTVDLGPHCDSTSAGWSCTRQRGHTGRHAAGNGERIVAVWP